MFISRPAPDVVEVTDAVPLPGLGVLPVNAYVLYAAEPVLIDTGLRASSPEFMDELWSLVEPEDLRWVYLTHPGGGHTGCVFEILDAAPRARLVTTSLGMGLVSLERRVPPGRAVALDPGERLDAGDRRLTAFRPPVPDSPAATGLLDERTGACFSSDSFGAPVTAGDLVESDDIGAVPEDDLVAGQRLWAAVDSPWLATADRDAFLSGMLPLHDIDPSVVLGSHLPPAHRDVDALLDNLTVVLDAPLYAGPDQAAFRRVLADLETARA